MRAAWNRIFTDEMLEYIKSIAPGCHRNEITELLNLKFNLNLTINQVIRCMHNNKIVNNLDCRFKKGHEPINKGTKGIYNVGGNKTSFKNGQKPVNTLPIGSEIIDRDGYTYVKISDTPGAHNIAKRWIQKQRLIYQQHFGKIPKNHKVIFADGDKSNFNIDNLLLVTSNELVRLNQDKLYFHDNAEATKSGLALTKLKNKIIERNKGKNEK